MSDAIQPEPTAAASTPQPESAPAAPAPVRINARKLRPQHPLMGVCPPVPEVPLYAPDADPGTIYTVIEHRVFTQQKLLFHAREEHKTLGDDLPEMRASIYDNFKELVTVDSRKAITKAHTWSTQQPPSTVPVLAAVATKSLAAEVVLPLALERNYKTPDNKAKFDAPK